jgi:Mn2+/Fe2+ NRAMP family transporter
MWGGYELLKKVLAGCVGAMFVAVTLSAVLLRPDWREVARGLIPSQPAGSGGWIVGLIGAIGGTMALISYGYWIREEGRSGREGLEACRFDLLLSYGVIGLFGVAVIIVGSRVQVSGQGAGLALLLADQLGLSLGTPGRWVFLGGFWALYFRRCSAYGRVFRICSPTSCGFAAARRRVKESTPIWPSLARIVAT